MWKRWLLLVVACLVGAPLFHAMVGTPDFRRQPPRAPVYNVDAVAQRVDKAFADAWQRAGLEPTPRADDLLLARRLSLALMGAIPSVEEIRRLEQQPPQDRLTWWLGVVLADRRSADYLAERIARATVGTDDGPFLLYRRRRYVSWLADQIHANRPYDEIVRHIIADSGVWTDTPAVNFITIAIKPDTDHDPDPAKLAARVSRAFLGLRLDCAECHNHPFEPWKQRDFQSLAAFFGQTRRTFGGIRDRDGEFVAEDHQTGERRTIAPAVPYQSELLPSHGSRRQRLAAWTTNSANQRFARAMVNRMWAMLLGHGLVMPVDNIPLAAGNNTAASAALVLPVLESIGISDTGKASGAPTSIGREIIQQAAGSEPAPLGPEQATLEILSADFVEHGYDLRRLVAAIVATRVFQLDSRGASDAAPATEAMETARACYPLTRLRPEQVAGGLLQAGSLETISYQSHIVFRVIRQLRESGFIKQYGDLGADEFDEHTGAMPQRLLMMNGQLVHEKTKDNLLANAATQIAVLAPDDARAVEIAMLAILTRRPTPAESERFVKKLREVDGDPRNQVLEDICWTLLNSTEFAWNH